jgi:hypothetical protein
MAAVFLLDEPKAAGGSVYCKSARVISRRRIFGLHRGESVLGAISDRAMALGAVVLYAVTRL